MNELKVWKHVTSSLGLSLLKAYNFRDYAILKDNILHFKGYSTNIVTTVLYMKEDKLQQLYMTVGDK